MRALLLSCGPSLNEARGLSPRDYDVVIGVNNVVKHVALDWWVFGDLPALRWTTQWAREPKHLFVKHNWPDHEVRRQGFEPEWLDSKPRIVWREASPFRAASSGTAALVLASHLNATTIDAYGYDLHGDHDFEGNQIEAPFGDIHKRWGDEIDALAVIAADLRKKDVVLNWNGLTSPEVPSPSGGGPGGVPHPRGSED